MATSKVSNDGSENVSDFLRRIEKLDFSGDDDETHNAKRLEDEILEGRKQREARRAERARSISPEKQSPAASLRSYQSPKSPDTSFSASSPPQSLGVSSPTNVKSLESVLTAPSSAETEPTVRRSRGNEVAAMTLPDKPASTVNDSSSAASVPTRSGTLSWQQRPTSLRGPRTRPLSFVGRQSPSQSANSQPLRSEVEDDQPSRDQIAQALGSKDPTWFRQTPDRGVGSAAYRQSPKERDSPANFADQRRELHGLAREDNCAADEPLSNSITSERSDSSDMLLSDNKPPLDGRRADESTLPQEVGADKQPQTSSEAKDPAFDRSSRPTSPTKGVGGFVQSAMMRRSDSVGKRWSVQSSSSSRREKSTRRDINLPADLAYESEKQLSDGNQTLGEDGTSVSNEAVVEPQGEPSTPTKPIHHRSRSVVSVSSSRDLGDGRPSSPSKRWSPVKSSWLENALNKPPDSPKPARPESMQPSWMVDLNRRRQQSTTQDSKPELIIAQKEEKHQSKDESKAGVRSSVKYDDLKKATGKGSQSPPVKPKPGAPSQASLSAGTRSLEDSVELDSKLPDAKSPGPGHDTELSKTTSRPETPPKKDFRSSMQIREAPSPGKAAQGDLEFQNVFGKLRRTETKNYVAPDTLKANILRGKAGLAATGGPQKSARKDEFKESLIQQKVAMKAKAADPSTPTKSPTTAQKEEIPVPEAIAKKKALSSTSGNAVSRSSTESKVLPAINADVSSGNKSMGKNPKPTRDETKSAKLEDTARKIAPKPEKIMPISTKAVRDSEKPPQSKMTSTFNSSLASIIAKGPPSSSLPGSSSPSASRALKDNNSTNVDLASSDEVSPSGSQLQHMTKSRARGPKRRLPKTHANPPVSNSKPSVPLNIEPIKRASQGPKPTPPRSSRNVTPSQPTFSEGITTPLLKTSEQPQASLDDFRSSQPKSHELRQETETKSPLHLGSSAEVLGFSPKPSHTRELKNAGNGTETLALSYTLLGAESESEKGTSLGKLDQRENDNQNRALEISKRKRPIMLPTRKDEERAHIEAGLIEKSVTSKQSLASQESPRRGTEAATPFAALQSPASSKPVSVGQKSPFQADIPSTKSLPSPKPSAAAKPAVSPKPQLISSNKNLPIPSEKDQNEEDPFQDFFHERPVSDSRTDFDSQAIVDAGKSNPSEAKTLRKHIVELTGDGKQIPRAQNEEHILFTSCMYLCTHIFGDAAGTKVTEVYLWAGSRVSESAIEDAQIFARRAAKENNGKLVLLRQNKESQNFLQALGGIVITRDGNGSETSRPYMLLGRSHLGHITFDEVDFAADNLCTGFPFIISPNPDTFYLWKGRGCGAEEIGSARLISMDLGPTSKVFEIEEGKESAQFLSIFPPSSKTPVPRPASYWPLKAKYDNYKTRLFRMDDPTAPPIQVATSSTTATVNALWSYMRKTSQADIRLPAPSTSDVTEISPFSQEDLEPEHIYVLDAFFVLYIIVGSLTSSKAREFARALLFAQDYAIVAASSEDRPSVPPGTVVFGRAPSDMKAHFRRWDDEYISTSALMAGHAKGGQSQSRLVPLNRAIEALKAG